MSEDLLDTPVSDEDLATIADYITKWEVLRPHLGLTYPQEVVIRNTFHDYDDQKREALQKWTELKGEGATYRAFITAANKASNTKLVDKVKAMLGITEKPTGKMT